MGDKTPPQANRSRKRRRPMTPEGKSRNIFNLFESDIDTLVAEENEYLVDANPGDLLVFTGNNQLNTWRKICRMVDGEKIWVSLPYNNDAYGKKRRRTKKRIARKRRRTKRRPTKKIR
tara:strand:- start:2181 stop:2534 length:354 start_codon:yes stop_codon:yes gene_type:complete